MDKLNLSLFKEKKLQPLSVDIKGIIKLYLLPCRKQIECNRQLLLFSIRNQGPKLGSYDYKEFRVCKLVGDYYNGHIFWGIKTIHI